MAFNLDVRILVGGNSHVKRLKKFIEDEMRKDLLSKVSLDLHLYVENVEVDFIHPRQGGKIKEVFMLVLQKVMRKKYNVNV